MACGFTDGICRRYCHTLKARNSPQKRTTILPSPINAKTIPGRNRIPGIHAIPEAPIHMITGISHAWRARFVIKVWMSAGADPGSGSVSFGISAGTCVF